MVASAYGSKIGSDHDCMGIDHYWSMFMNKPFLLQFNTSTSTLSISFGRSWSGYTWSSGSFLLTHTTTQTSPSRSSMPSFVSWSNHQACYVAVCVHQASCMHASCGPLPLFYKTLVRPDDYSLFLWVRPWCESFNSSMVYHRYYIHLHN